MNKQFKIQVLLFFTGFFFSLAVNAQDDQTPSLMLTLNHYTKNNSLQFLKVQTQVRTDNKIEPVSGALVQLYLDSDSNLVGKVVTGEDGVAFCNVPPGLRDVWNSASGHSFIAVANAPHFEETTTELSISKAKLEMDTINEDGKRTVAVRLYSLRDGNWQAAADVDVKIGVKRLGGSLKIGEDETYTTDSTGVAAGEFLLDSLPAVDAKGNIVVVASVEDNDDYGNLSLEKTVPWGKYYKQEQRFGERSLWAARFRSPLWLMFIAYSIIAGVWGVVIYLVVQIFRIKKLGREKPVKAGPPAVPEALV